MVFAGCLANGRADCSMQVMGMPDGSYALYLGIENGTECYAKKFV